MSTHLSRTLIATTLSALLMVSGCDTAPSSSEGVSFETSPGGFGDIDPRGGASQGEGNTNPGAVGEPCIASDDCLGQECLPEEYPSGGKGFPDGYCTQRCGDVTCPLGSACTDLGGGLIRCMASCASDAACRDGYICDERNVCFPSCATLGCASSMRCDDTGRCVEGTIEGSGGTSIPTPTPGPDSDDNQGATPPTSTPSAGEAAVGEACAAASECFGGTNAYCFEAPEFPQGYCSVTTCDTVGCDTGSSCYSIDDEGTNICLRDCQSDDECRSGYICMSPGACIPGCASMGCEGDEVCAADGRCAAPDGDCTDTGCAPGQSCINGACVDDTPGADDEGTSVGSACASAASCVGGSSAVCLDFPDGYCTVSDCVNSGCPGDASCWDFQEGESYCLDNCTTSSDCREGYLCDGDNTCWPGCAYSGCAGGLECLPDGTCAEPAPCSSDADCLDGMVCTDSGNCVPDTGWAPTGTPANCPDSVLPSKECSGSASFCGALVPFDPRTTSDYDDYPINGETAADQWRSYPRRDLAALVRYATAYTTCMSEGWPGNGGPLGLGDMSEANGAIPGTAVGQPGHPENTHVNGFDMDIAYYQFNTPDNKLRSICPHYSGGQDAYHCTSAPDKLDVWRTALVLGAMLTSNRTRVIGIDGRAGVMIEQAMDHLCDGGWLPSTACSNAYKLAYETTNEGLGWYYFHHHHFHISLTSASGSSFSSVATRCLRPDCQPAVHGPAHTSTHSHHPGHGVVRNPMTSDKLRVLRLPVDL